MKQVLALIFGISLFTACVKEEPLTPNTKASGPTLEIPATGGSGSPEFFDYTLNGTKVNLTKPSFSGSSSFGQILSQLSQTNFFQIGVILSGSTFPDTNKLSSFSTNFVYNETLTKRYNGEAGEFIFTSDAQGKLTGTFDMIMKNIADANDSIIITNGSFSVNK
ncbi:MAG: hypothetical protein JKY48_06300 [Flavobacteriales bacterium]|nr:hypothetical protein [Flavobacteriales bacterium]